MPVCLACQLFFDWHTARKNSNNDQMWNANEKDTPKVNTPVEIIFKLVPPTDPKTKTKP